MTTYQSEIKTISSPEEVVFGILSDLNNLGKLKDDETIKGKLKIVEFNPDSCLLELNKFGEIGIRIVEKQANKSIRFEATHLPIDVMADILLKEIVQNETHMQIVMHANLPSVLKIMVNKQLEQGVNILADLFEKTLNSKLT